MKPRYFNNTSSLRSAMLLLLSATCISLSATAVSDTLVTVKNAHEVTVKADSANVEINIKGAGEDPTYAYHFRRSTDKAVVDEVSEGGGGWDFGIGLGGQTISTKSIKIKVESKNSLCIGGVGFGFVSTPGAQGGVNVDMGESLEIYWDMLYLRHKLANPKHRIEYGIGLDWRNYRLTGHERFEKTPDGIIVSPYPAGATHDYSRIRTLAVTFPLRYRYAWTKHWDFSVGAMLNINARNRMKTVYNLEYERVKDEQRNIHGNRVTVDFMGTLNYRWLSLFVKYSPCRVLDRDFAPAFTPLSVGIGIGL